MSLGDLKTARLVCRKWYFLSNKIIPNKCSIIPRIPIIFTNDFKRWITSNPNFFDALTLTTSTLWSLKYFSKPEHQSFWYNFCRNLKHLIIEAHVMPIRDNIFESILQVCTKLETLCVNDDPLLNEKHNLKFSALKFEHLETFHYTTGDLLEKEHSFENLTKNMRSLKEFKFTLFWHQKSSSNPTSMGWKNIFKFIKTNSETLLNLQFDLQITPGISVIQYLSQIDTLSLEQFSLRYNSPFSGDIAFVQEFLSKQKHLKELEFIYVNFEKPYDFSNFLKYHPNLKVLKINGCRGINVLSPFPSTINYKLKVSY